MLIRPGGLRGVCPFTALEVGQYGSVLASLLGDTGLLTSIRNTHTASVSILSKAPLVYDRFPSLGDGPTAKGVSRSVSG